MAKSTCLFIYIENKVIIPEHNLWVLDNLELAVVKVNNSKLFRTMPNINKTQSHKLIFYIFRSWFYHNDVDIIEWTTDGDRSVHLKRRFFFTGIKQTTT